MSDTDKILDAMRVDGKKGAAGLAKRDSASTKGVEDKKDARGRLADLTALLDDLQYKLYAEAKTALLVVIQAMDTGGKDGVIRKVFGPINPQGVDVASFKRPTDGELAHDYLWRIHARAPAKGMIGIFNRSHYEDVLVRRVHRFDSEKTIQARYRQINEFERHLTENGTAILKFHLHISKDEQRKRLQARLDNPKKRWKFELGDLDERKLWAKYQDDYQKVLDRCATRYAPWYVIPADNKWYRDWSVAGIVVRALRGINPRIPKEQEGLDGVTVE